jgi:predicted RNase H-like nuclease (RuvC/YqgF family)
VYLRFELKDKRGVSFHISHSFYSSGPDYAARRQRIHLEIQELENKHTDAQATLKTNKHHYFQLSSNVQKLKSEECSLKQELQENLRKIGMLISVCTWFFNTVLSKIFSG